MDPCLGLWGVFGLKQVSPAPLGLAGWENSAEGLWSGKEKEEKREKRRKEERRRLRKKRRSKKERGYEKEGRRQRIGSGGVSTKV